MCLVAFIIQIQIIAHKCISINYFFSNTVNTHSFSSVAFSSPRENLTKLDGEFVGSQPSNCYKLMVLKDWKIKMYPIQEILALERQN